MTTVSSTRLTDSSPPSDRSSRNPGLVAVSTAAPGPIPRPAIPELLAPAGDWECARAAIENGADAIYFGLDRFNARMRAQNFTEADLPDLMEFLHHRGVRGYVTFNTLVFQDELPAARDYLRSIIHAGVDAAIVQDVGICRLIRELSPDFPIHASTQMTITSASGVEFARDLGAQLVVLARENSLREILAIQKAQSPIESTHPSNQASLAPPPTPLPLEVFVHGALCVAYSGQCLTSEALGGRSANRGECAQACRMPYELYSDGRKVDVGERRYLLSPQDLAGLDVLPELVATGVRSLKIEGRLKSPEYVASVTRIYRNALDQLLKTSSSDSKSPSSPDLPGNRVRDRYELEMSFSRGLYTGWFEGINNQRLVHARFGKKRGVFLGDIAQVRGQALLVRLQSPLKAGDGVVIDSGIGDDSEQGGRVISIHPKGDLTQICLRAGQLDPRRIRSGDKLWKTSDPELEREIRKTFGQDKIQFTRPINLEVFGAVGTPMTVWARDEFGACVDATSDSPLASAENHPLDSDRLREQLGRLGGTPYHLGALANHLEGSVILPVRELNQLRRTLVDRLDARRKTPLRWSLKPKSEDTPLESKSSVSHSVAPTILDSVELIPLVRDSAQLTAALECGISTVYCEFEDPKRYRDAVQQVRQHRNGSGTVATKIVVAPPRITKPGEEWILKQVRSCDADGYLVRNYDHLKFFAGQRCIGDFSLNVANARTAAHYMERFRLEQLTASYDLNVVQLEALLRATPSGWFQITLHQHMPMFHMEHCVFCAFLSQGTDFTNCGRPCDRHRVELKDRVGMSHPLKADAGCRNTVFHARAQTGAEHFATFRTLGVRQFRIEFVDESADVVKRTLGCYKDLAAGSLTGSQLWQVLKVQNQLGVTRGQLDQVELRKVAPKSSSKSNPGTVSYHPPSRNPQAPGPSR